MIGKIIKGVFSQTFLVVWAVIVIANQLFIFHGCFAPYCLIAALPHTSVIAALITYFINESEVKRTDQSRINKEFIQPEKLDSDFESYHQPINVPQTKRITLIPNGLNPNIVLEQNIKKTLGRSPDNSIVVNNEYISKHHLTVLFDGAYVYIEDLNSTNGSYFDGEKLTPGKSMRFPDGKRLLVGSRDVIYTLGPIS